MDTSQITEQSVEHTTELDAPARRAYGLIADVSRWPLLFSPCLAAEVLDSDADCEHIRLWASVGDHVRSWTSIREFDEAASRVAFRQENPAPPVTAMSGFWAFEPATTGGTRLSLGHRWAISGSEEDAALIESALDRNSEAEIAAVREWAERAEDPEDLVFAFEDKVEIAAAPEPVYEFLHRAELWPRRVNHVQCLDLSDSPASELTAGAEVQTMEMRTRAPDGTVHATRSIRLCFDREDVRRILYKQTTLPDGLLGHTGTWDVAAAGAGTIVTARHQVALDPSAVERLLGPGTSLAKAREAVRAALSANSLLTLEAARRSAEEGPATP